PPDTVAEPADATTVPAPTLPPTDPSTEPTTEPTAEPTAPPATTPVPTAPRVVEPELFVEIELASVVDVDDRKPARAHDPLVAVAFADIERWWSEVFPGIVGQPFEPLAGGVYAGYPERVDEVPGCGEPTTDYADLQLYV